ncbi:MAG: Hsp20/alpha crystallin family protein [Candidatus Aenigmatarchaeota archaeon]
MAKKKVPLWFEDPFERMGRLEEEMRKTMRQIWTEPIRIRQMPASIAVDISERDGNIMLKADMPGFDKDEIQVKVSSNTVEMSAERKKEKEERGKTFYRRERSYGSARRTVTLPEEVLPDKSKAKFEHGVLTLVMPKAHKKRTGEKEIKVE